MFFIPRDCKSASGVLFMNFSQFTWSLLPCVFMFYLSVRPFSIAIASCKFPSICLSVCLFVSGSAYIIIFFVIVLFYFLPVVVVVVCLFVCLFCFLFGSQADSLQDGQR